MIDFFIKNDSFIMTILTMVMGIYAGFIPLFKSQKLRIGITSLVILVFNLYICVLCYYKREDYPILCEIVVLIISIVFILLCIIIFKPKDIVNRRKLGKIIMNLTKKASIKEPICIFGGDLDFFGNVKQSEQKKGCFYKIGHIFTKDYNSDIKTNKQMQQIIEMDFSKVHILCLKPSLDDDSDNAKMMRLRYGYIAHSLKEKVKFKFLQDDYSISDSNICKCDQCSYKSKCKKPGQICSRLEALAQKLAYNPDTQLRGRIIELSDTKAKDIILTTTIKCKKAYRIREYGLSNKNDKDKLDWKLYEIIWNVWWGKCSEDEKIIENCITEYQNIINKCDAEYKKCSEEES